MTLHEWLRARLLGEYCDGEDIALLRQTQWCGVFIERMRARMVQGWYRYGPIRDPDGRRWDNIRSAISRLERYLDDGNQEHLVDAANLCLIEHVKGPMGLGSHPEPHFAPVDDGVHTQLVGAPRCITPSCGPVDAHTEEVNDV